MFFNISFELPYVNFGSTFVFKCVIRCNSRLTCKTLRLMMPFSVGYKGNDASSREITLTLTLRVCDIFLTDYLQTNLTILAWMREGVCLCYFWKTWIYSTNSNFYKLNNWNKLKVKCLSYFFQSYLLVLYYLQLSSAII